MLIAIDFDGTCVTHAFPEIGKDIGAAPVLRELVGKGHKLILWTMRSNNGHLPLVKTDGIEMVNGDFLAQAEQWFKENNIELYAVNCNPEQKGWTTSPKCYAELYIDDAALGCPLKSDLRLSQRPFVDWDELREYLKISGVL